MSNEFDKDKVLARVKKMMTLANDAGATEGERDNALRMAHATLAKYNLTMAEADAAGKTPEEARSSEAMTVREHPWMRTVANAIAKLFFCQFFYIASKDYNAKYYFVGKTSNIFTAQEMFKYVARSIDLEGRKVAKEVTGNSGGTYWRSFCKGAAHKVYNRCIEIQRTAEEAPKTPGTALVLASVYELERQANERYIAEVMRQKIRQTKSRQRGASWDAYHAGAEFGGKIGLNNQLGGGRPGQKQIK